MIDTVHHRRRLHVQLELLTRMLNSFIGHLLPTMVLLMFLVTVSCNVLIARIDGSNTDHQYLLLFLPAVWSTVLTVAGLAMYRLMDTLRSESVWVLNSIQQQAMIVLVQNGTGSRGRNKVALGRMLGNRKPLEVHFGHFYVLSGGLAVAYARSVLENTVNGVFMVESGSRLSLVA